MVYNTFDAKRLNEIPIKELFRMFGIELKRNKALCMFHDDKTPSLSIKPSANKFHCFACGASGGVIDFVIKYKQFSFIEACEFLSKEFCIGQTNFGTKNRSKNRSITSSHTNKELLLSKKNDDNIEKKPNPEIYKWFFDKLIILNSLIKFVESRKYPLSVIKEFGLKSLSNREYLLQLCLEKWGADRLINCGLVKMFINEVTGEILYKLNWWTDSLLIPFYDNNGDIIYIQGRTLDKSQSKKFKYVNLSGVQTPIFNLPVLGNLNPNDDLIITEGITDCISCQLMGKNAIGIIGANGYKSEYNKLLYDYKITIIPDNDESGLRFAEKIRQEFLSIGKNISIYKLNAKYKDISEFYKAEWAK